MKPRLCTYSAIAHLTVTGLFITAGAFAAHPAQALGLGLGKFLRPPVIVAGAKLVKQGQSHLFDFGKNTKPRYVYESKRPDGSRSFVYGNHLQPGKTLRPIGKPHGHSVVDSTGKLTLARPPGSKKPLLDLSKR